MNNMIQSPSTSPALLAGNSTVYSMVRALVSSFFSSTHHSTLFFPFRCGFGKGSPGFCFVKTGFIRLTYKNKKRPKQHLFRARTPQILVKRGSHLQFLILTLRQLVMKCDGGRLGPCVADLCRLLVRVCHVLRQNATLHSGTLHWFVYYFQRGIHS